MSEHSQWKSTPFIDMDDEDMLLDDHNPGTSNPTLSDIMEAFTSLSKKVDSLYSRDLHQQGNAVPMQCPIETQQGNAAPCSVL